MKITFLDVSLYPQIHTQLCLVGIPAKALTYSFSLVCPNPNNNFYTYCIAETSQPPQAAGASSAMDTPELMGVSSKANSPSFFPSIIFTFLKTAFNFLPDLIYILEMDLKLNVPKDLITIN